MNADLLLLGGALLSGLMGSAHCAADVRRHRHRLQRHAQRRPLLLARGAGTEPGPHRWAMRSPVRSPAVSGTASSRSRSCRRWRWRLRAAVGVWC